MAQDLQSLLDYHIYGLYMCGIDQYGKNQIYMTYDGVKWIASMYDMDSTWGLYWNGQTLLATDYGRDQYEDQIQGRLGNLLYERMLLDFCIDVQYYILLLVYKLLRMLYRQFKRF